MLRKVDHIGIAVDSLEERLPFWAEALGLNVSAIETVESEQVKVAFLPVGGARIELLEATSPQSSVARYVERNGPGIHHLTFEVAELDNVLTGLRDRGVEIIGDAARPGADGSRVAFIHPRASGGVLVELVESDKTQSTGGELEPGAAVVLYLREPQEKMWGVLRRLDATGVMIEGLDLGSFDDWLAQIGHQDEDGISGPSIVFVPIGRVEKVLLDRPSGPLPSLVQRVERRAGCTIAELIERQRAG